MYFQNVIRVVLVFFLAIEVRTVDGLADGRIVSLDANEAMATLLNERRRIFRKPILWLGRKFEKYGRKGRRVVKRIARTVRNPRRWYRRYHPRQLRNCKKYCPIKSVTCGAGYAKCVGKCIAKCYAKFAVKHIYRHWRYRG